MSDSSLKWGSRNFSLNSSPENSPSFLYLAAGISEKSTAILITTPSAELYRGQTDESELGASYRQLDKILKLIEAKQINKIKNKNLYQKIIDRIKANRHKGRTPKIIKWQQDYL